MIMVDDGRGGGGCEVMTSSTIYLENENENRNLSKITALKSSMKIAK